MTCDNMWYFVIQLWYFVIYSLSQKKKPLKRQKKQSYHLVNLLFIVVKGKTQSSKNCQGKKNNIYVLMYLAL